MSLSLICGTCHGDKKTWTHSLTLPFPKRSCKILQNLTSQAASGGKISDCSLAQVIQKEIALACGSTPSISQHHVLFALFHHLSSIYIYIFHYLVFIMSMWLLTPERRPSLLCNTVWPCSKLSEPANGPRANLLYTYCNKSYFLGPTAVCATVCCKNCKMARACQWAKENLPVAICNKFRSLRPTASSWQLMLALASNIQSWSSYVAATCCVL